MGDQQQYETIKVDLDISENVSLKMLGEVLGPILARERDKFELTAELLRDRIDGSIEESRTLAQRIAHASPWSESSSYGQGSFVRHRNVTWMAAEPVQGEPPAAPQWLPISDSIEAVEAQPGDTADAVALTFETVAGRKLKLQLPNLRQVHRGGWSPRRAYGIGDVVVFKHGVYSCKNPVNAPPRNTATNTAPDLDPDTWELMIRAPRGPRGPKGEPGRTVSAEQIGESTAKRMIRALESDETVPLLRFGGSWAYGQEYSRGTIISFKRSLWIAKKKVTGDDTSIPPDTPRTTADTPWERMLTAKKPPTPKDEFWSRYCELKTASGFYTWLPPIPRWAEEDTGEPRQRIYVVFSTDVTLIDQTGITVEVDSVAVPLNVVTMTDKKTLMIQLREGTTSSNVFVRHSSPGLQIDAACSDMKNWTSNVMEPHE